MTLAGWQRCKLGDVLEVKHGYAFKGEYFADSGTHVVLTPGNFIDTGGFKSKGAGEKWYRGPIPDDYVLREGDLLVAMTEQAEGLLGSSAMVPEGGLYLHNQRLGLVEVRDESRADKRFLYYLFNSKPVRAKIRATATGAKVRHTAPSRIAEVAVDLPPLLVQRRVAGILSAYDELIEIDQGRIRILVEMVRSRYREWFMAFHLPATSASRISSGIGAALGDWEGRFGDLVSIERVGVTPAQCPDEEFEHFSIPAFDDGRNPAVELGASILSGKYRVDASCLLLSKLNPHIARAWLPRPTGLRRAVASTEFLVLKPKNGATREFVYAMCTSTEFADQFATLAIGTSTSHQRVKPDDLLRMATIVPDAPTMRRFASVVRPMLELSDWLRMRSANLNRTRDLLLPRLLSGEIKVGEEAA